ncbi:hypothetical protein RGRSB_0713 [cyanobacterium endosymbiont of Rhopalodia gibberula]|uniref:DUF3386 domain-containing protein n=1 Tax=cyanobacterium endosymbiont of Rhopalodia gibberula TaxID=1763363 RepID=UPI000DC7234B|nr:DUF3386 domain-containing protein [cyanobacterium endosymbiont of Rhopalodia gibberula]BBA79256.1 hypothetical protein RGRSB_0713 [cyanobacterium endosymbiont of Rhopalodia gibberula]
MTSYTTTITEARELFRAAYENRYTWDSNFPGYTADVTYQRKDKIFTGQVRVNQNLSAEVLNVDELEIKKELHHQLWEIAIHRIRRAFEDTHGQNTFTYGGTDDTGAVKLLVGGKSEGDSYKVRNNEVCYVYRHIHGIIVTINTFSSHNTGEGYLSHRYDSVYHDSETGELKGGTNNFEDNYEKVGRYYILASRIIQTKEQGQIKTETFNFSNIQLLSI